MAGCAGGFALLLRRRWRAQVGAASIACALLAPLAVPAGTWPFMLGLAFGLWALVALQAHRPVLAWILAALAGLAHPLAFLFLIVALAGLAWSLRARLRHRWVAGFVAGMLVLVLGQIGLARAFGGGGGFYRFDPKDALAIGVFCSVTLALTRGLNEMRPLRVVIAAYGLLSLAVLLVPSPIGSNVGRLQLVLGAPLLLVALAARRYRPRWLVAGTLGLAVFWQVLPLAASWPTSRAARADEAAFWTPAIAFLASHPSRGNRVEVVDTAGHWEAYYLARRGVPLTRGWFRQDDYPQNAVLYGRLTPVAYRAWLGRMGVRYVLLPDDPLDPSAQAEARLLRSGRSGLRLVERDGPWTFYELPRARTIAGPSANISVLALNSESVVLRARAAGTYRLSLSYTPYWQTTRGDACAAPAHPWWTLLRVGHPGVVALGFDPDPRAVLDVLAGVGGGCRTAPRASVRG